MENTKYGVIRTDLLSGTDQRADMVSLRYMGANGKTPTEIENGSVVVLDGLMEGEREIRVGKTPTASAALDTIAIVATPEMLYDERKKNLSDFINEAGKTCRGYIPRSRNIFSVTAEGLDIAEGVTPEVGYAVELGSTPKLKVVASATSGSTKVGEIIAIDKTTRYTYYVIKIA